VSGAAKLRDGPMVTLAKMFLMTRRRDIKVSRISKNHPAKKRENKKRLTLECI
jgi:hypothetical protein